MRLMTASTPSFGTPGLAAAITRCDKAEHAEINKNMYNREHVLHIGGVNAAIATYVFLSPFGSQRDVETASVLLEDKDEHHKLYYLHVDPGQHAGLARMIHTLADDLGDSEGGTVRHDNISIETTQQWVGNLCELAQRQHQGDATRTALAEIKAMASIYKTPAAPAHPERMRELAKHIATLRHIPMTKLDNGKTAFDDNVPAQRNIHASELAFQMAIYGHMPYDMSDSNGQPITWCGCIAGLAGYQWGDSTDGDLWESARTALGLDQTTAVRLFVPNESERLTQRGVRELREITPAEAAEALRHIADGGTTPWAHLEKGK